MLTQWLPDTENKLPPNASHQARRWESMTWPPVPGWALLPGAALQPLATCKPGRHSTLPATRTLPSLTPSAMPVLAVQVGVGAVVLNERGEILVVQERSGPLRGKGVWKMPTGLVQVRVSPCALGAARRWEGQSRGCVRRRGPHLCRQATRGMRFTDLPR